MEIQQKNMDKICNVLCLILFACTFIALLFMWKGMPNKIPVHFNLLGEADEWGSKSQCWLFPVMSLFVYIGIGAVINFPGIYNNPVIIKKKNKKQVYSFIQHLFATTRLLVVCVLTYISFEMIFQIQLPVFLFFGNLFLAFINVIFWFYKIMKLE